LFIVNSLLYHDLLKDMVSLKYLKFSPCTMYNASVPMKV
jgi:hypothetical protein